MHQLTELPTEIIMYIASYLTLPSMASLGRTNKRLHALIHSTALLPWKGFVNTYTNIGRELHASYASRGLDGLRKACVMAQRELNASEVTELCAYDLAWLLRFGLPRYHNDQRHLRRHFIQSLNDAAILNMFLSVGKTVLNRAVVDKVLIGAASMGSTVAVESILDFAFRKISNDALQFALITAAQNGNNDIVRAIMACMQTMDLCTVDALMAAYALRGSVSQFEIVIQRASDKAKNAVFVDCCLHGIAMVVEWFLTRNVVGSSTLQLGFTCASITQHAAIVELLCDRDPSTELNLLDKAGSDAHADITEVLMVAIPDRPSLMTSVLALFRNGHNDTAIDLLKHQLVNYSPAQKTVKKLLAKLIAACTSPNTHLVSLMVTLLTASNRPLSRIAESQFATAFMRACRLSNTAILTSLLFLMETKCAISLDAHGINRFMRQAFQRALNMGLASASQSGNLIAVRMILQFRVIVDQTGMDKAALAALRTGNDDVLAVLKSAPFPPDEQVLDAFRAHRLQFGSVPFISDFRALQLHK